MNKQRKTSNILNVFQYNETTGAVTLPSTLDLTAPGSSDDSTKVPTTAWVRTFISSLGYVTLSTDQTITGLKTIVRVGSAVDVLNFKIGTDNLYALKIVYNQNELVESGEATWSFANTFNNGSGTGITTTPISFFRGVLVTGQRLLSASVNANLLDYYGNNPSGRYPVFAYNTGVQQFATGVIVGDTAGVVNAATGAIADLPAGVVANFKGRVIGSNAVNNNEFVTLSQLTNTSGAYLPLSGGTLTGALNGTSAVFSGNVGINGSPGTSFPLEAYINSSTAHTSSSRGNVLRVYNPNTAANIFAGIELGGAGTANDGLAGINGVVTGSGSGALSFYTRDSNTFAERFRIASTGAATFSSSVTAVNAILSGTGSAFADGLRINRTTSNSTQYTIINHVGGATNIVSVDQSGNNIAEIYFGRSINGSTISTSMVINGSGNVGIGASSLLERLSVSGNIHVEGTGNSIYFDTSGSGRAIRQYVDNLYDFHITNGRGVSSRFILGSNVISLGTTSTPQFSMTLSTAAALFTGGVTASSLTSNGSISASGNISGATIFGSLFQTSETNVYGVGTSFVNSGTSFTNTTGIWLVSVTGSGDGNMYSAVLYIVTTAAYSKTINLVAGPSNHFGNGSLVAQLSTNDGFSAELQVRRTTSGTASVNVKIMRIA